MIKYKLVELMISTEMNRMQQLVSIIMQQAEQFLLDAGTFYPFATYVNHRGETVPVGAFVEAEKDQPSVNEMITLLEKASYETLASGECLTFAIAVDVAINEAETRFDAVKITITDQNNAETLLFKYQLSDGKVIFLK